MHEWKEIVLEVIQAVIPVIVVVFLLQVFVVSMPTSVFLQFLIGAAMVMAGLVLFLQGVQIGLLPMGEAIGAELPNRGSIFFLVFAAFMLGFVVTVAEPDVRILASQVEFASEGEISKTILITMVALGVAFFVGLAMLRIVLGVPIAYILAAGYAIVLILSFFTPENFVPIAFDAGGVTTGPMTVPFILSLGLGTVSVLGGKSSLSDGFGLVGLASIGPIIAVLLLGVMYG
ncbi:DUF1538 domain-containing protein [Heliorestis convoluta]|uniref:DUF1538 domain-containing protein n=1 Tax=Heliorestis convoluta TaxID=356322 RepID=A0A5Q2MZR4_9FIRM|nr:hypothetical protein FTV88_0822 [Heliorestis convoluta]